jgi:hypothetical protein
MPRNKIKKIEPPPPPAASPKPNLVNDITSNIFSGFTFGIGSSIARNAIDSVLKPKLESKPESSLHSEYLECLKHNHEDTCKSFFPSM